MSKEPEDFRYADLVGFDSAIADMHKLGVGLDDDKRFADFKQTLVRRHGISAASSFETMLFRSASRQDARQFMLATGRELGVPGVRMFMEETPLGYPVLMVVSTSDVRLNPSRGGFGGPGVLMLEDVDLWGAPFGADYDEYDGGIAFSSLSRGAREAVMFIRSAVDNPEVQVLATCGAEQDTDDFLLDLLEPVSMFELDLPSSDERAAVWSKVCDLYPSIRALAGEDLVRLSRGLSRSDIYSAAREAVDQAFRSSMVERSYVPVTHDNLYDKIAAYQDLESSEYREIENAAVERLLADLESEWEDPKGND